jgi:hypothetical protein
VVRVHLGPPSADEFERRIIMKKLVTCCVAVGSVVAVGIVVRQVLLDLSDNADLWMSVTDVVED